MAQAPDVRGHDLSGLDLSGLDLRGADLSRADLHEANLSGEHFRFVPRQFSRAELIGACERAVELDSENGGYRDSRGLARALTGDRDGAIEDFEFYVAWAPDHGRSEESIERRRAWIQALKAGEEPFDETTLAELR